MKGFVGVGEDEVAKGSTSAYIVLPSEIHSGLEKALPWEGLSSSEWSRREDVTKRLVRLVLPLIPPSLVPYDDITRRVRTTMDPSMFKYPLGVRASKRCYYHQIHFLH